MKSMNHFKFWGLLGLILLPASGHAALARKAASTALTVLEGGFGSAVIDTTGGTALFGRSVTFISVLLPYSALTSVTLSPLDIPSVGSAYYSSVTNLSAAAFDDGTRYAYFASSTTPARIELIPMGSGSSSRLILPVGYNAIGAAVIDSTNHVGYFGTHTSPAYVVKVNLPDGGNVTSMSYDSALAMPSGFNFLSAAVIDVADGFAYFASSTTTGGVAKIRLSDFTLTGTISFASGEGPVGSAVIDTTHGYAYFGTLDSPGKVVEVKLNSFARTSSLTLNTGENQLTSAVLDSSRRYAYFGTNTSSGVVVPVRLTNLSERTAVTLSAGEDYLRSAVIDATNGYAYFGTYTTPGRVIQMDLLSGPPEILVQPGDVNVNSGVTATFYVSADGRAITYQWQMNGVDIPGATSSSYSRVASAGDDGSLFRCVLTNASGSVATQAVELTIIPIIRVYPNPWRADRHTGSDITFDGLLPNSTVKIFTLSARWMKTLPPATGSTTWDRTNDAGQRVASGYYFYLITSRSEDQTVRGKLAIIR